MKYRGIISIVGLILQGLLVFSPGGAAWAQSESRNEIGEGTAETPQLRPASLCAILIGIDDPALADRARLTAQSDVESIGRAVEQLAAAAGKSAKLLVGGPGSEDTENQLKERGDDDAPIDH